MKALSGVILGCALAMSTHAQHADRLPRFEDFPVTEIFKQTPAEPVLAAPEERRFRTVIRQGVSKGSGVEDGITGEEVAVRGPNFAGHYAIVKWGCGSPCLMAAIVDLKSGTVYPPPFHHGSGHSYFQVPWAFPMEPPLAYRLDSRLLIANICEADKGVQLGGRVGYEPQKCGAHYFVMTDAGLKLLRQVLDEGSRR